MRTPTNFAADRLEAALTELRPGLAMLDLPCCVIDTGRRYRFVNRAFLALAGGDEGDFIDHGIGETTTIDREQSQLGMLVRALAGEELRFDRQAVPGAHGGRWVCAHYLPVRRGTEVVGAAELIVDIPAWRDAHAGVAARERQLSLITDTIGFPVTYIDRNFVVRFANAQSAAWTGLKPEEMVGRPLAQLAPPQIVTLVRPPSSARSPGNRSPTSASLSGPAARNAASAGT